MQQQINHNKHLTQTTRKTNVNVVINKQITNPQNKRRRDETNNKQILPQQNNAGAVMQIKKH